MRDAVDAVIEAREALDHGFSGSLLMSGLVHGGLVAAGLLVAFLTPTKPLVKVAFGEVIPMSGGRGNPNPAPKAPAAPPATQPAKVEPAPEPEPPPQIAKPPQPTQRQGLPDPDVKPSAKPGKPEPPRPLPRSSTPPAAAQTGAASRAAGGGGTSTANEPIGLAVMPDGPGVGRGIDSGDYYMAGVQRKIWSIWLQQVKQTFPQPVVVMFTINPDGSVPSVQVTQSSGVAMLDLAARRAVQTAAPFSAFPRDYENRPITVQAEFRPTY